MASQYPENRRTDEQLEALLFEAAEWTVNGHGGKALCATPSLRRALERAADFAATGAVVVALCRLPGDDIIVFEGQAERLRKRCAGLETAVLRETDHPRAQVTCPSDRARETRL